MKIFYWSPHISHVATVTAVTNSVISLKRYSSNKIKPYIIDSVGEWNDYKINLLSNNIETIKLYKKEKYSNLPRFGFIRSRTAYWIIFLSSFLPLKKIISIHRPDYLIVHLITSLPIILNYFFNLNTKIILRISGLPKLNFFRWVLWKIMGKKIYKVVCPTVATKQYLLKKNIFKEEKIHVLKDPIVSISKINILKKEKLEYKELRNKKYILSVGRITKQKNYFFLVDCFREILKYYPEYNLVIVGEGEDKAKLKGYIKKNLLDKKILLFPFKKNIYNFMKNSDCYVMSSLWEDPGFVLIEAASVNKIIISSNCPNGPIEFLSGGKGGFLYESNDKKSFVDKFKKFKDESDQEIYKKILITKKNVKNYTLFKHFCTLVSILQK